MHVLIIASYAPSLLIFRGRLIADILARGHSVSVCAPQIAADLRLGLTAMGADVHELSMARNTIGISSDLSYLRNLRHLMVQIRPDIVLTYTAKPNIWGTLAARSASVPSVAMITGLGYAFAAGGGGLKIALVRALVRRLYGLATRFNRKVIFQNPDDRDDFIAAGCLRDHAKVAMIDGSGVDLAHYNRTAVVSAPVFLMIARLLRGKGVREYALAARSIRADYKQARFLLVGPHDGGPDAIAPSELDHWVADGILEWRGALEDVRPALAEAAVYVLPSYREGTPRSVLEAMAMGRPIITSDAPGCRETIRDGIEGFLVPARDANALARAMKRFIEDPGLIATMGDAAHHRAVTKYDVRCINQQMMMHLGLCDQSRSMTC